MKTLSDTERQLPESEQLAIFQRSLKKLSLYCGTAVRYYEPPPTSSTNPSPRGEDDASIDFLILDHFCVGPLDLRFVIKCSHNPSRILAITKASDFDVRGSYGIKTYHAFQPTSEALCDIVRPQKSVIEQIRHILHQIFDPLKVYIVKKSLCSTEDIPLRYMKILTANQHILMGNLTLFLISAYLESKIQ